MARTGHGSRRSAAETADDGYMTPQEFAALPSDVHHQVWALADHGQLTWAWTSAVNGVRRYHRQQVRAVTAGLERGAAGGTGTA